MLTELFQAPKKISWCATDVARALSLGHSYYHAADKVADARKRLDPDGYAEAERAVADRPPRARRGDESSEDGSESLTWGSEARDSDLHSEVDTDGSGGSVLSTGGSGALEAAALEEVERWVAGLGGSDGEDSASPGPSPPGGADGPESVLQLLLTDDGPDADADADAGADAGAGEGSDRPPLTAASADSADVEDSGQSDETLSGSGSEWEDLTEDPNPDGERLAALGLLPPVVVKIQEEEEKALMECVLAVLSTPADIRDRLDAFMDRVDATAWRLPDPERSLVESEFRSAICQRYGVLTEGGTTDMFARIFGRANTLDYLPKGRAESRWRQSDFSGRVLRSVTLPMAQSSFPSSFAIEVYGRPDGADGQGVVEVKSRTRELFSDRVDGYASLLDPCFGNSHVEIVPHYTSTVYFSAAVKVDAPILPILKNSLRI